MRSGWDAQSKVRALSALVKLGDASPLSREELRRLLEGVANEPPPSARGAQAGLAALEVLERLDAPPSGSANRTASAGGLRMPSVQTRNRLADMAKRERHFESWDYGVNPMALEQLCSELPVLGRQKATAFFDEAERVSQDSRDPREGGADGIFASVPSTLVASDRQDFDASCDDESEGAVGGVLMVETYDPVINTLVCVARVSEDTFLSRVFSGDDVQSVKALRG